MGLVIGSPDDQLIKVFFGDSWYQDQTRETNELKEDENSPARIAREKMDKAEPSFAVKRQQEWRRELNARRHEE
ncbi:MAG: hypothetical protein U0K57_03315 [Lachnospiraceae bacterium]|nr:hypothetical protein [Lachnospiraceae bacterium]